MSQKEHLTCQQPDHDCPGLICGHPLPCPWHTIVFDTEGKRVEVPEDIAYKIKTGTLKKVIQVAKALSDNLHNG